MEKTFKLYNTLKEQSEELDYWKDKSFEEKISAMEQLRQQFWPDTINLPLDRTIWRLEDLKKE